MKNKGFSTILLVITISFISLLMATTASFLSLSDLEMSTDYMSSKETLYLLESCFENTLSMIQDDNSFIAYNYSLSLNGGLCILNVADKTGLKDIVILASKNNYYKEIVARVSVGDKLGLLSYKIK